ncbi:OprO/OprP family phosphate-selective porin [Methylobacterium sp. ID0610]|uniref:OprO/OprP family phosphate-selective porin n=1 Tax=Methylobacterium carpenticola TaxID=3344827 RepID=UPI0036B1CEAE
MKRDFRIHQRWLAGTAIGLAALAGWAHSGFAADAGASAQTLPRFVQADLGVPGVTLDERGITVKSPDDAVRFRIGGRLQLDPGFGGTNPRIPDGFGSNIEVRRAWIETYLTINNAVELAFQYDLNTDRTPIQDAAIGYHGIKGLVVSLGNFKEPFSLQQLISDNNTTFVERALPDSLVPARNTGFAVAGYGDRWTLAGGVFGGNINTGVELGGIAGTVRATYAPILSESEVLHLGVAGSFRSYDQNDRSLSFSSKPEEFIFQTTLINTSTIRNANNLTRFGAEVAYQNGPLRVQGEYIRADVGRSGALSGATFEGGYVEGAWVINGKGRRYALNTDYGTDVAIFKGVQVGETERVSRGGIGVFELAARYSILNLKDGGIAGGVERDWTAGVNWYPDRNIRLMANYTHATADGSPVVGGQRIEADIAEFRLQLYW